MTEIANFLPIDLISTELYWNESIDQNFSDFSDF